MSGKKKLTCWFCGGRIRGTDGCVNIADEERPPYKRQPIARFNEHGGKEERGQWSYPGNGQRNAERGFWSDWGRRVVLSHYECGPADEPYWVPLDRIEEDWEEHLSHKPWWNSLDGDMFEKARAALGKKRILAPWRQGAN